MRKIGLFDFLLRPGFILISASNLYVKIECGLRNAIALKDVQATLLQIGTLSAWLIDTTVPNVGFLALQGQCNQTNVLSYMFGHLSSDVVNILLIYFIIYLMQLLWLKCCFEDATSSHDAAH